MKLREFLDTPFIRYAETKTKRIEMIIKYSIKKTTSDLFGRYRYMYNEYDNDYVKVMKTENIRYGQWKFNLRSADVNDEFFYIGYTRKIPNEFGYMHDEDGNPYITVQLVDEDKYITQHTDESIIGRKRAYKRYRSLIRDKSNPIISSILVTSGSTGEILADWFSK